MATDRTCMHAFGIGIEPQTWYLTWGDGAQFEIYIEDGQNVDKVFIKYINPRQNPEDRKWHDYEVDLAKYGGKSVNIVFVTTPGPADNNPGDHAHWSEPIILARA